MIVLWSWILQRKVNKILEARDAKYMLTHSTNGGIRLWVTAYIAQTKLSERFSLGFLLPETLASIDFLFLFARGALEDSQFLLFLFLFGHVSVSVFQV